jgi:acetyl esterase/lipase
LSYSLDGVQQLCIRQGLLTLYWSGYAPAEVMSTMNRQMVGILFALFLTSSCAFGQQKPDFATEPTTLRLWSGAAPGALGTAPDDIPTLTLFRPFQPGHSKATGTAVIVAPGGAYITLADNHEGRQVANWLNSLGVTGFVLKYRLAPRYKYPVQLEDMQRAIRVVRSRASEFGISRDRIGVMGFSAGGHLASMAGTHFDEGNPSAADTTDRASSRPDFLVLAYPLISFRANWSDAVVRRFSEMGVIDKNASPKLLEELSTDLAVTSKTPPTFLFSTSTDDALPPQGHALLFYVALQKNHVPAEIHVFQSGPHGVGLDFGDPELGEWPVLLRNWLDIHGWLRAPAQKKP